MVTATVDNTPVTVLLSDNETYTPSTGSVQKVTVAVAIKQQFSITQGGQTERIVDAFTGGGEPNGETVEMVITDTETLVEPGGSSDSGIYISGFEVS